MKYIVLSIVVLLLFSRCKPEEDLKTGSVTLDFNASFGNAAFELIKPYNYMGVQSIKFSKLDFYITGIELLAASNLKSEAVGLIDFTGSSSAKKMIVSDLPAGSYTGLRFIVGVKPDLNKKLPKDFDSNNPLASSSHYWDTWNSYIFMKIEGVLDTAGKGSYDLGFAIHTGTDECVQQYEIIKNIEIKENATTTLSFDLDVKKIFARGAAMFDLSASPLNHNPTNLETLKSFSSRMPVAIAIKN